MESNEMVHEFKTMQINNAVEESDPLDCLTVVEQQEDKIVTSEQSTSKKDRPTLHKLSQQAKSISQKLAMKHKHLQEQNKFADSSIGKRKESDTKVLKSLGIMRGKFVVENDLYNETYSNSQDQSVEELEAIVDGFQRLVLKLYKDQHVKHKIIYAVRKINVLKDMPFFKDMLKEQTSDIERSRYNDLRKIENSIISENMKTNTKLKDKKLPKESEKEENTPSPAETFAKYINKMLCEYLGDNQQEQIEKYKCLPDHINDLEPFANALVQVGYGIIVEGEIRINRKNNYQAFITMPDKSESDAIVLLPEARRYAFDGDIVRAFVLNRNSVFGKAKSFSSSDVKKPNNSMSLDEDEELLDDYDLESSHEVDLNETLDTSMSNLPEKEYCCKAFVIRIVKQEVKEIVGSINFQLPISFKSELYYKLRPNDTRIPVVFIPKKSCNDMIVNNTDDGRMLYLTKLLTIDKYGHCIGKLIEKVGSAGDITAEVKAILLHNGFKDLKPYEEKYNNMWSGPVSPPSEDDLRCREDCRTKCVFTIDPSTAKDLDDAVSVEKLDDSVYEIGVHISDVSHYLEENSELDNLVKNRATSIYLTNEVIHMLPKTLCLRCSLLPGEDKFAFSVFWKWHIEKNEIGAPRFTRSIINSCCKFAYEDVQDIIDSPAKDINSKDIPEILNGWTSKDIKWRILLLNEISQKLKARRFENGALAINNPKLCFYLSMFDEPLRCEIDERKEANFLIEEFMLLANQSVAKFIHDNFPEISILRNHPPPIEKSLKALKERLNVLGLKFDISSSKSIYESMQRLCRESRNPDAVEACLSALLTKPMSRARYFCSEGKTSDGDFWHYALSIPIYTHFTSPIRRYPDILVHRLLAAALNYCPPPQRTTEELHHIAKVCNDQKLNAKNVSDESTELFFKHFVQNMQPLILRAVVMEIFKNMANIVTVDTGHTISITYSSQKCNVDTSDFPTSILLTDKYSKSRRLKLQIFATLNVNLYFKNDKICGSFAIFDKKPLYDDVYDFSKMRVERSVRLQQEVLNDDNDNIPSTSSALAKRNH